MDSKKENTVGLKSLPSFRDLVIFLLIAGQVWNVYRDKKLEDKYEKILVDLAVADSDRPKLDNGKVVGKNASEVSTKDGAPKVQSDVIRKSSPKFDSVLNVPEHHQNRRNFDNKIQSPQTSRHSVLSNESHDDNELDNFDNDGKFSNESHIIVKRGVGGKRRRCRKKCMGRKGAKGDRGEQGYIGAKGDKGLAGKIGPSGNAGPQGIKGERGSTGSKGDQGQNGSQGLKGEKGDKGQDGNAKTTEVIHLVGQTGRSHIVDMSKFKSREDARFKNWKQKTRVGKLRYSDGYIHIKVTGIYYIYCQIHYSGKIAYNMHSIYKNQKEKLLLGFDTFNQGHGFYNQNSTTKFTAGVFHLSANDNLSVMGIGTQYTFQPESSNFGVFLIHAL